MKYQIYKFVFQTAVHFGSGTLDSTNYTFSSDTLFSALCQEAVKAGNESLVRLVELVKKDRIRFSDAFPYLQNEYYLPKPVMYIGKGEDEGNSVTKKAYKKLKYIALSEFGDYMSGKFDPAKTHDMKKLGYQEMKVSANIRVGEDTRQYRNETADDMNETLPYRISIYRYNEGCGLYIIFRYEQEEERAFIEELLTMLSYAGIGGRRSAGFGRFAWQRENLPAEMTAALDDLDADYQMLLSQALPMESELEKSIRQATYFLVRRSGFVSSTTYADEFRRKKDLYVFASGSVFRNRFKGDLYDVSDGGRHAVYRYAKPIFMGLNRGDAL